MKRKAVFSWILAIALFTWSLPAAPASTSATSRSFVVETVDGPDVTMTKGAKRTFAVRAGTRLGAGYTVTTGKKSYAGIKMDDNSNVSMDESTKIDVSKASRTELMITVVAGSISVNAGRQAEGSSTTFKAGNTTMGIRGTTFNIGQKGGVTRTILIEGELEVETPDGAFTLKAGYMMEVTDGADGGEGDTEIYPLDITVLGSGELLFLKEHLGLLLDLGILSEEEAARLDELIAERLAEEEAEELERLANLPGIDGEQVFPDGDEDGEVFPDEESHPGFPGETGPVTAVTEEAIRAALEAGRDVIIPAGTNVTLSGVLTVPTGRTLTNAGAITVADGGRIIVDGALVNNGTVNTYYFDDDAAPVSPPPDPSVLNIHISDGGVLWDTDGSVAAGEISRERGAVWRAADGILRLANSDTFEEVIAYSGLAPTAATIAAGTTELYGNENFQTMTKVPAGMTLVFISNYTLSGTSPNSFEVDGWTLEIGDNVTLTVDDDFTLNIINGGVLTNNGTIVLNSGAVLTAESQADVKGNIFIETTANNPALIINIDLSGATTVTGIDGAHLELIECAAEPPLDTDGIFVWNANGFIWIPQ
jgi:hypothetical protein